MNRKIKGLEINKINKEAKNNLKKRLIAALIMLTIFIPCLVLGGWYFLAIVILLIGAATYEIARAPSRKLSWFVWLVTFIIMYCLIFWVMIKNSYDIKKNMWNFDINTSFAQIWVSPVALAVMIGLYFFVVIIKSDLFTVLDACYLIAMTLILSLGFQAALYIRYIPFKAFADANGVYPTDGVFKYAQSMFLMIYLLIAIFFNDIGAYLTGMLFGKHKMNPKISPKKTWEGFVGGIIVSAFLSTTFGLLVACFDKPMLPIFTIDNWYRVLLISFFLPLVAVLGDLAFSAIKRQFGKKDYSNVLGAHGGVLDRIDSTLFGALTLSILIIFITKGWDFLS